MTATKVVDASAIAALLYGEPEGQRIADAIGGHRLMAPALLPFELANVCWKKCKRDSSNRFALVSAFALLDRLMIEMHRVDFDAVLSLALDSGLTTYDASYLWLSRKLSLELVTLDRTQARVAALPGA